MSRFKLAQPHMHLWDCSMSLNLDCFASRDTDYFGICIWSGCVEEVGKLKAQVWDLGGQESIRYVFLLKLARVPG